MDAVILTLFAALPFLVLLLFLSDQDTVWSVLFVLGLICLAVFVFYSIYIIPNIGNSIFKWTYIGLTGLLPAVLYMLYVIKYDKKKPETVGYLLQAVLIGIIAAFVVTGIGSSLFIGGSEGELKQSIINGLSTGFLQIAIPAEVSKWLLLYIFLYHNKYYDEYLDGIVYSVCLSMGFASVLGIWFMSGFVDFAISTFLLKGVVSAIILIPIHLMSGAAMGYFLAISKRKSKTLNTLRSLIFPIIIDGVIFSLLATMGDFWLYYLIIVVMLFALSIVLYGKAVDLMILDCKSNK